MAQYSILADGESLDLTDGVTSFRVRADTGVLYYEQYIAAAWVEIGDVSLPAGGDDSFRLGVRNTQWVIDQTLLGGIGFSGAEDTDWSQIEGHSL